MAQDDDIRDDTTGQEYNEDDRVSRTEQEQGVDPAEVRDDSELRRNMEDADMDDTV